MQTTTKDGETIVTGTTDSLNLDVYTTEKAEKLPVLVYVHGGNNQTGSSFEIPGNDIVKTDDCVYVSVNYRLGLLGFNSLPALIDEDNPTGNFAMLDLAKSLQWVKDNIENFGGDPENVTVSGFSAGGRDVMAMLISPTFKDLFSKAIAFSGGMTVSTQEQASQKIADTMAPLVVEDKKAENEEEAAAWLLEDTDEVRDYLYGLDADRVINLFPNAGIRMAKFPHLYVDDVVLPMDGFDGEFVNDVPLMMVTGSEEFSMLGCFDPSLDDCFDLLHLIHPPGLLLGFGCDVWSWCHWGGVSHGDGLGRSGHYLLWPFSFRQMESVQSHLKDWILYCMVCKNQLF